MPSVGPCNTASPVESEAAVNRKASPENRSVAPETPRIKSTKKEREENESDQVYSVAAQKVEISVH